MTAVLDSEMVWRQFGAAIDMLENALRDCPDDLWDAPLWGDRSDPWIAAGCSSFWYISYHTLFWLDLYLSGAVEGFAPPAPFDLGELDPAGVLPPRTFTRQELLDYLAYCRHKCKETLRALTPQLAERPCVFPWGKLTFAELHLYNLRHVMEHGGQLRMFLGQQAGKSAKWVAKAKE